MGFLFESDNLACASPTANFLIGNTFSFTAWVYLTDITNEQVIWCKAMIHGTGTVSQRACVKVRAATILIGVNNAVSTATGTYTEINTLVTPRLGWNFIAVLFDANAGVSRI